ncbi:MAG: ABC transporter transmembrane domain-containing protein, partial [Bacilli bacterium]
MKKNYNIIKDYFKTIKPNKKYTIFLFLTALFSQLLNVIVPLIYGTIIKLLTNGDFELFYNYLILYGVVLLSSFTLVGFNFKVFGYFYRFIYTDIQSKLISKLNKLNIDYFSSRSRGKFLNISNDDANVLASFGDKMNDVLVMFLYVVFAQIIIFYLNFYVGLVVLFINFVNIFIMDRANDKAQKNIKKKN